MRESSPNSHAEELPQRLLALEPQAFQDFGTIFGPAFRRHFLDRGLQPFEAQDLAVSLIADIPLKVLDSQYQEREPGSFRAWVLTIMRNAARDWWRRRQRRIEVVPILEDAAQAKPEDPHAIEDPVEIILAVREAVAALPESLRQVVELRNMAEQQEYAEIADSLGISSGAARVRHSRALAQLTDLLSQDPRLKRIIDRAQPVNG